jgi:hypothetical protein
LGGNGKTKYAKYAYDREAKCSRFSSYFYSLVLRTNSYAFRLLKRHLQ